MVWTRSPDELGAYLGLTINLYISYGKTKDDILSLVSTIYDRIVETQTSMTPATCSTCGKPATGGHMFEGDSETPRTPMFYCDEHSPNL